MFWNAWHRNLMRSGMVTGLLLAIVVLGLSIAYRERGRGHLHKLEQKIVADHHDVAVARPGGQEAIQLTRTRIVGSSAPEFLSMTLLPGRGMNVLQITAYLPDRGVVSLLASPSVEDAERVLTGKDADADGRASLAMGGAFELPWAGRIWGTPTEDGGHVNAMWHGHSIVLPAFGGSEVARDGLMLTQPSDSSQIDAMPDGGQVEASFHAGDFGAHWPSKTDVATSILLTSRSIELTVVAHNAGDVAEPIGIGWHPRFAILDGHRDQLKVRLSGRQRLVRDRASGQPTGTLQPVAGTSYDFLSHGGTALGTAAFDDCFVDLHQELLDSGPVAELSDPAGHFGLRLTALSSTIKAMRLVAPPDASFLSLEPQYNYDDPFGKEWAKETETGMVLLQPGQSTQWKIRLELYSLFGG